LTNIERARAGCGALTVDARLAAAAQAHSTDMAANGYFGYTGRDGRGLDKRLAARGYTADLVGENIAAGSLTAARTVQMWMDSADRRATILTCAFTAIGVGYATGGAYGTYWTQDFAGADPRNHSGPRHPAGPETHGRP
jgi:uncharacterized protein YkwD